MNTGDLYKKYNHAIEGMKNLEEGALSSQNTYNQVYT